MAVAMYVESLGISLAKGDPVRSCLQAEVGKKDLVIGNQFSLFDESVADTTPFFESTGDFNKARGEINTGDLVKAGRQLKAGTTCCAT
jgi:hypothetical protein